MSENTEFKAPRHWVGPEELSASFWVNTAEKRGQEFFEKPIEQIDQIDRQDQKGFARRDFLQIMGASMAMMTMACARRPVRKIIPYVDKPEGMLPGVPVYYASSIPETGEGILVKNREGRPIKLEGNPDHPLNQGALSARGQASLLSLYDPERLQKPVARTRSTGGSLETSWDKVDASVVEKLKAAKAAGKKIVVLTGRNQSPTSKRLMRELGMSHVEFELISDEAVAQAQMSAYGQAVVPFYRYDSAEVIVSFGADFLDTDPLSTGNQRAFSLQRKLEKNKNLNQLHVFEAMMSGTGSNSDFRYGVRPGDEVFAALAVAHALIVTQKRTRFATDSAVVSALQPFSPAKVAEALGIHGGAGVFTKVADALFAAQGKGIVLGGTSLTANAFELGIVAALLNSALGNEGSTVNGSTLGREVAGGSNGFSALSALVGEMNTGKVGALVIAGANPCYNAPAGLGFEAAMKNVGFIALFSEGANETSQCADLVLPQDHALESWGDVESVPGVVSLIQPAIAPINDSKTLENELLVWGKRAGLATGLAASVADSEEAWHDYLKANWKETRFPKLGGGHTFESFWENSLKKGAYGSVSVSGPARSFRSASVSNLPKSLPSSSGLRVGLYEKSAMGDGKSANNAWLQELPDPVTKITWDNYANISPKTAHKMGMGLNDDLITHDVIRVTVDGVSIELPTHVQPGLHDDAVMIAVGYGRRFAGKVALGAGVDVTPLMKSEGGRVIGSGRPVTIQKTGRQYQLATTQWHHLTENRPVINDLSLEEWKHDPSTANHTNPHLRMKEVPTMWKKHQYLGNRWGMSIDLTACTGCGACVIACQAENNIPVVGRQQVRNSRIMHWMRIDRYYTGDQNNPDVVYQPMICQHCENAPCETVCPVLATVHDDEGLNSMSYNRCVGTRYCQNNCPYKVRRFNFFDHWKTYTGTMNMVWNPEVTVRTRGVMEKCTFCVQRINDAKFQAKGEGRAIKDGDLKTACQQTCATDAIVFGNINDPESTVSKMKKLPRDFRVLEDLNVLPVVSYLSKVRNKPSHHAGGEHGQH